MMSLIADQSNQRGKVYGQECKGEHMCIGGGSSRPPEPTQAEKDADEARESQKAIEQAEREDARQDVLDENITRKRRGTGRRSLLKGSGGGIGFYNEYDK